MCSWQSLLEGYVKKVGWGFQTVWIIPGSAADVLIGGLESFLKLESDIIVCVNALYS